MEFFFVCRIWDILCIYFTGLTLMGVGNKNNDSDMGGELCLRKRSKIVYGSSRHSIDGSRSHRMRREKEIEFWNLCTGPDGENMVALIDGFNATNPEYKN